MVSLVKKIRHGEIWDFPGGIHPPENKIQSTRLPVVKANLAEEFILPIKQHIGRSGDLAVKVGDKVLKGQQLTKFTASFMLPVHAPTSGEIVSIEPRQTAHPSGLTETCFVLKPDGKDQWAQKNPLPDFKSETPEQLINVIRHSGIAGLGGAGFPTGRKIQSGIAKTEILIINAAECEPYITADDMLMRENAFEIIEGIQVLEYILKPDLVIIAVEDNKPEAIKALEDAALNKNLVIRAIPTKYPSGGEKQLIKILTNKEVPQKGIPADIGVLVQNVGTVHAIKKAVIDGEPLIERIVTLTGKTFAQPINSWVRLGTPVQALLDEYGYKEDKKSPRIIMGGPMMGFTLPSTSVPITKTTNCLLAPTRKEIAPKHPEVACIRCGQCAEVCPASLLPQQLFWYSKDKDFDKCEELNLSDCIECGACAYVCPSEIPLVHYYRQAKAEIRINKEESESAERAKLRFEERKARLERDKEERESRFKAAAESRRKEMNKTDDDAVAAAIARVKALKSDPQAAPAVKPAVAAAIARAKAKQADALKANSETPDNSEMAKIREERKRLARERKAEKEQSLSSQTNADNTSEKADKKTAVAAAIARAKAKKAAQAKAATDNEATEVSKTDTPSPELESENKPTADKKKAAVAAAIARAKAKKTAQAKAATDNEITEVSKTDTPSSELESENKPTVDKKKAAVAAAIARAKAKKTAQAKAATDNETTVVSKTDTLSSELESENKPTVDNKKAAVAAAIARAKAKKTAQAKAATDNETTVVSKTDTLSSELESENKPTVDKKKAAVAAAIARAKAKKAAQAADKKAKEKE
ncbi:electron transport complex subunit RsxC [Vibrio algarum]|uniref:Ion-translocating oxidoreductase complex subunit C n=1 Tax=Vibrio algarum TaxID=3020714 RepID=A0ABT4YPX7_9VIBR|nr:electron transport complex subunit RsxC [Vibrio sp. KJ40-1]MDB1123452.1 electron transport complex subunit RsxC [Vibrio sp. KJ40-1]